MTTFSLEEVRRITREAKEAKAEEVFNFWNNEVKGHIEKEIINQSKLAKEEYIISLIEEFNECSISLNKDNLYYLLNLINEHFKGFKVIESDCYETTGHILISWKTIDNEPVF